MAQILVENKDACDYIGYYTVKTPGQGKGVINKKVTVHAQNTTKVDEDLWMTVIGVNGGNNTIAKKIEEGRIVVLNAMSDGETAVIKEARARSQMDYQTMVHIYRQLDDQGGKKNSKLAPHLDDQGIPSLELVRKNMGNHITGEKYEAMTNRLRKEVKAGLHTKGLIIPGEVFDKGPGEVVNNNDNEAEVMSYEDMVSILAENYEELDEGAKTANGAPRLGALREMGITVNKEERDHLWKLYSSEYVDIEDEEE